MNPLCSKFYFDLLRRELRPRKDVVLIVRSYLVRETGANVALAEGGLIGEREKDADKLLRPPLFCALRPFWQSPSF